MALTTVSSDRLSTNVKTSNLGTELRGKIGENKNKIINGGMTVSQRHGTSVVTGVNTTGYRIDRWTHQIDSINSAFSVSQSTDTPDEFGNSYKIDVTTADTSLAAAHAHFFRQKIEGQNLQDFAKGTSAAKQFAVSFYVKTNKTGVYTVELYDVDNNRQCSKTFTVADSNWNRYTLIYPADTTGAFGNDNNNSLVLQFWLSAGSNFTSGTLNSSAWASATTANRVSSSNVNLGDNTSNEWYITGVQLEVGSVATEFEHRSFAQELALCHRYFLKFDPGGTDSYCFAGKGAGTTGVDFNFILPRPLRASPTVALEDGGGGNLRATINATNGTSTSNNTPTVQGFNNNVNMLQLRQTGHSSMTDGVVSMASLSSSGIFITFSSEL